MGAIYFLFDGISYVVLNDFLLYYLEGKLMIIIIPMEKTFSRAIDKILGENEVDDLLTRTKKCAPIYRVVIFVLNS